MNTISDAISHLKDNNIQFVDFQFTDLHGTTRHISYHIDNISENTFTKGVSFDGSSLEGWCDINKSDMLLIPDMSTLYISPFTAHKTAIVTCNVSDPITGNAYNRCPRSIAERAEEALTKSGIAEKALFGPELEFFLFNEMNYSTGPGHTFYKITSDKAPWSAADKSSVPSSGHTPDVKGAYFISGPEDKLQNVRSEMVMKLKACGLSPTLHHAEVASGGQCEVGMEGASLKTIADHVQTFKAAIHQVAGVYGLTATFMPKPISRDNGSGMHVHQSLWKGKTPLFAGDDYDGLSEIALYYIGGIIKHARALNAFTNPSTNSYKRLIPGYEAPVMLAYAARNRSASIRIPAANEPKAKRIETRFPDPMANPYLCFSALLMAGLDGIANKIHPGDAREEDLYELSPSKAKRIPQVCGSLREALDALNKDRAFLKEHGVFDDDLIDSYMNIKLAEVEALERTPHPIEFKMYYSR